MNSSQRNIGWVYLLFGLCFLLPVVVLGSRFQTLFLYIQLEKSGQPIDARVIERPADLELHLQYYLPHDALVSCRMPVSKFDFDQYAPGDTIHVIYLPKSPQECRLASTIAHGTLIAFSVLGAMGLLSVVILFSFVVVVKSMAKKSPPKSSG